MSLDPWTYPRNYSHVDVSLDVSTDPITRCWIHGYIIYDIFTVTVSTVSKGRDSTDRYPPLKEEDSTDRTHPEGIQKAYRNVNF